MESSSLFLTPKRSAASVLLRKHGFWLKAVFLLFITTNNTMLYAFMQQEGEFADILHLSIIEHRFRVFELEELIGI